ncbi:MAG: energy transducer TonB [Bacteroidetes bacterium QS_8_64_10]|nr:MAG: energy transducer TonB [Bacteroidetes bacterium QS_8_64_10]
MAHNKDESANLRNRYPIFIELGLVVALGLLIAAFTIHLPEAEQEMQVTQEQETVQMKKVKQTQQTKEPPPPPAPPVPVEVPNEEKLEKQKLELDATLDVSASNPSSSPPAPPGDGEEEEQEQEVFVTVEQMPEMKDGLKALRNCIEYPEMAKRAGVEGRVTVEFVVNKKGNVENPKILGESLGAGLDEEAIRCVKAMDYKPGKQRGNPVKVKFSVPVNFSLDKN